MASRLRFIFVVLTVLSLTAGSISSAYALSKQSRAPRGVIQNIREQRERPSLPSRPRPINPDDLPTPHPHPYPPTNPYSPIEVTTFNEGNTSGGSKPVWNDIKVEPGEPVTIPASTPKYPYVEPIEVTTAKPITLPQQGRPTVEPVEGVGVIVLPPVAQTVKFFGKVQDAKTRAGITGARIYSVTSKKESFSVSDGSYSMYVPVSDQSQVIEFSATHYATYTVRTIISSSTGDVLLYVSLQPLEAATNSTKVAISGNVYDSLTLAPLSGAAVLSSYLHTSVYTDSRGYFTYAIPVSASSETATLSKSGYETKTVAVPLNGAAAPVNMGRIELTPTTAHENVSLYGWVEDTGTHKRLAGVKIYNQLTRTTVYSDDQGNYSISMLKGVLQTITFTKSGYKTYTAKVNPDSSIQLIVRLTK